LQGLEAIFCGQLVSSDANICLFHAKLLSSGKIEITVRTTNKFFTESVVRCAERLLQG